LPAPIRSSAGNILGLIEQSFQISFELLSDPERSKAPEFVLGQRQEVDIPFSVIGAGEFRKRLDSCIGPNILREKLTCNLPVVTAFSPCVSLV
jgi:hypothetical protein